MPSWPATSKAERAAGLPDRTCGRHPSSQSLLAVKEPRERLRDYRPNTQGTVNKTTSARARYSARRRTFFKSVISESGSMWSYGKFCANMATLPQRLAWPLSHKVNKDTID